MERRVGAASAATQIARPRRDVVLRRRDVLPLTLTRDGRLANEAEIERLTRAAGTATDCFVFCHGWLYDEAEARRDAGRFFALLDGALMPLGDRVTPLRLGLHWPSKPFADGDVTSESRVGVWPELERRVRHAQGRAVRSGAHGYVHDSALGVLRELADSEIPRSPEEEAELDILRERMGSAERGGIPTLPFEALSFWAMKRRAGEVGERLGRECLAPLWQSLRSAPRLHLIGHSFGAKLVTSAVLGGSRPDSLTLLLGAFSAFAFAAEIPRFDRPGFYHRVLAERHVQGPVVVLRSDHDTALATFYRTLTTSGEVGRSGRPRGTSLPAMTEAVATSALGAVGARGVAAPELDLIDAQRTGLPRYPIVNVDGSRVVRANEPLVGSHRDIYHAEVATLVAMAAGLLVGGPAGSRPRPIDPRVER